MFGLEELSPPEIAPSSVKVRVKGGSYKVSLYM